MTPATPASPGALHEVDAGELPDALALLAAARLPAPGAAGQFVVRGPEQGAPVALVGVECFGPYWLLRSLVVSDCARGQRWGGVLVRVVARVADRGGVRALFLRTAAGEDFFARLGFRPVARHDLPDVLRALEELRDAEAAGAVVMRLPLGTVGLPGGGAGA